MEFAVLWLVVLALVTSSTEGDRRDVLVTTKYGALLGFQTVVDNVTSVDTFLHVPYAEPPLGPLRFRPTQPLKGWSEVLNATDRAFKPCPQPDTWGFIYSSEDEDCLYLNVYTPKYKARGNANASKEEGSPYPVFVWVHGGSYLAGTGSMYDGTVLAAQGVVVVTLNYRLAVLGFLSTGDDAAEGNYGMYDVIQALEWVRDVIAAFGGDPHSVTLAGHSAGGSLVSLLLTCPRARVLYRVKRFHPSAVMAAMNEGLFHKVVMMGGVSLAPFSVNLIGSQVPPQAEVFVPEMAKQFQCDIQNTSAMVDCLRRQSVASILKKQFPNGDFDLYIHRPSVNTKKNNSLFSTLPEVSFQIKNFAQVPTIRGFTNYEWAMATLLEEFSFNTAVRRLEHFMESLDRLHPSFANSFRAVEFLLSYFDERTAYEVLDDLNRGATRNHDTGVLKEALNLVMGDVLFGGPALKEVELSSRGTDQPQYFYIFSHAEHRRHRSFHGDDTAHVFGFPFRFDSKLLKSEEFFKFPKIWSDNDRLISREVMTLWVNFMKFGNPTPEPLAVGNSSLQWLPWTQTEPRYLDISLNSQMKSGPYIPAISFPYPLQQAALYTGSASSLALPPWTVHISVAFIIHVSALIYHNQLLK